MVLICSLWFMQISASQWATQHMIFIVCHFWPFVGDIEWDIEFRFSCLLPCNHRTRLHVWLPCQQEHMPLDSKLLLLRLRFLVRITAFVEGCVLCGVPQRLTAQHYRLIFSAPCVQFTFSPYGTFPPAVQRLTGISKSPVVRDCVSDLRWTGILCGMQPSLVLHAAREAIQPSCRDPVWERWLEDGWI